MAERRRGRASGTVLTAGLIACLCLGGSGCQNPGAVADDARPADPVRALHRAADTLAAAGSSRARTSMEMATGGTRVTIRGEGVYDFAHRRGRLRLLLPRDPAGTEHRPITELLTPGALFMKNRGAGVPADKWVRVDTATLSDGNLVTGGATDPFTAAEMLRGARTADYVGATRLGDTRVRHYRGTTNLSRAARKASEGGRAPLTAAAKGFATTEVPFDVFLDGKGRIRKLEHRFSFVNGSSKDTVAVSSTTVLYDFGAPADVRLPPAEQIYAGRIAEG